MRNLVAKHDFNRASTHKSPKDYDRAYNREKIEEELNDLCENNLEEEFNEYSSNLRY